MLLFPLFFFPFRPSSVLFFASLCFAFSSPSPPVLEWNMNDMNDMNGIWMTAMNSDSKSPELRLTEYFKLACVRHRGYTLPPKLYVSAYVMDQGGGLCPSDIWAPKSETSETPVVGGLEALTGSCLTLSSFRSHSPTPRSLAQKPVSCLQTCRILGLPAGAHLQVVHWFGTREGSLDNKSQQQEFRGQILPDSSPGPFEGWVQRHSAEEPSIGFWAKKPRPRGAERPSAFIYSF